MYTFNKVYEVNQASWFFILENARIKQQSKTLTARNPPEKDHIDALSLLSWLFSADIWAQLQTSTWDMNTH